MGSTMTRLWTTFLTMILLVAFGFGQAPRPCMASAEAPTCVVSLCSCHADKDHELRAAIAKHRCLVPAEEFAVARPAATPAGATCTGADTAQDLAPPAAPTGLSAPRAPALAFVRAAPPRVLVARALRATPLRARERPPRLLA